MMATYMVKSSELRSDAAKIVQGLRAGDSFVLMHYNEAVGYISPKIPKDILKKVGAAERDQGFKEVD